MAPEGPEKVHFEPRKREALSHSETVAVAAKKLRADLPALRLCKKTTPEKLAFVLDLQLSEAILSIFLPWLQYDPWRSSEGPF